MRLSRQGARKIFYQAIWCAANYCAERIHLQKKRPGVNRAYTPSPTDEAGSSPAVTPLAAASPIATTAATLGALLLRPGFIHD